MSKELEEATTCIQYLRLLYRTDPLIANDRALKLLLAHFPESRADVKNIITWKKLLRDEGIDIPKQHANVRKKQ